ncbi:MAG: carboxypeptidase-like regulatory domain-containing protein [Gemmatimonadota bacterium]
MNHRRSIVAGLFAIVCALSSASAQVPITGPDVIRGKVTDDSSKGVVANIMITRGPDRLTQQTTTDSAGNFSSRFEVGTGDYLIYVTAAGFTPVRRRVTRETTEHDFVANFVLARNVALLSAVNVTADRPVRASNNISPTTLEVGAAEKWQDGINGAIAPNIAGDLNAIAGTMSNVTMTGLGPSILGSGSESNLTTLNGMGLSAGAIPRAANTQTRVTGATFDPTRGGFAGANIDVRLGPGDRFFQRRSGFLTLDPQALQFTDAIGRSLGARNGGARGSLGANGEMIRQAATYNIALDVGRTISDPATLLDADADALLRAGVSPDSVARLVAVASPLGITSGSRSVPSNRQHDAVSFLSRFDDTRDTLRTRALTGYAGYTKDGALGFGPLAAPSASGERKELTYGTQLTLGEFVGPGRRILTESRFAASAVKTNTDPYRELPGASVLVRSSTLDASRDITGVTLGGASNLATDDLRWTAEGSNETTWNAGGRRHRFKTQLWGRADGLTSDGIPNRLGNFTYNSIEDLSAGHPASFTRTLTQPERSGSVWNTAAAIAHQWAPHRFFSMLYGLRVEADGFNSSPAKNSALDQALGVTSGVAPTRIHVSPRLGFSYTYNKDKENGQGTNQTSVGRFYRTTAGVIRGGIGNFRDLLRPDLLASASAATGLAGGTTILSCVGAAVPAADWAKFSADPTSIPTQCVTGSGVLAERAPAVTLIDPGYDVPNSWRASLDWNTSFRTWLLRAGVLGSWDLSQPGTVDANFSGNQRLSLASEGGRPVYVSAAAIDPTTGAVSAAESRRSDQYGRVGVRVSDLRGYGGQLNLGISPDVFKFRSGASFYGSLNYTLQSTKREFRGFDGASFGDPRLREWSAGPNDARHALVFTTGFYTQKTGTVTMFARAQSGLPFTPIVQGDINGDGRGGDRAFVPDPNKETDQAVATQIRALLANGASTAQQCLTQNLGAVAARNSCRGPWTQSFNIQWRPPVPSRWGGRVSPNVYLQNVLAGVDQLVNGSASLKGWGSPSFVDPVLLVPRGYDAGANRFRYDVNPRFADTRPSRNLALNPFRLVIDFALNLSTDYDLQQLRRAVEPIRAPEGWQRRSADSLTAFYLRNTSSVHKALIAESDSLFLSASQVTALRRADSVFSARVRAIYRPLGDYLSKGQGGAGKSELDSVQTASKAYWKVFWEQPEAADSVVTQSQRELFPMLREMVKTPKPEREHSQWQFGNPVTVTDKPKAAVPAVPTTNVQQSTSKP